MGAKLGQNSSKSIINKKFDENELLVHGFLRKLHPSSLPPRDICQLCYHFYFYPQRIFFSHRNPCGRGCHEFDSLDVTSLSNPIFKQNIISMDSFNSSLKYFDLSCYIPNIPTKHLIACNMKLKSKTKYDAILTRKLSNNHSFVDNILYIFQTDMMSNNDHFVLQSPHTTNEKFDNWLYCGHKWGIIAMQNTYVYQLKLQNISNDNLTFTQLCHEPGPMLPSGNFNAIYLDGRDSLFGFYNLAQCAIYDLHNHEWTLVQANLSSVCRLNVHKCFMYYQNDTIYLVSAIGHVVAYHLARERWKQIYDVDDNDPDFELESAVLWSYDSSPNVLYIAGILHTDRFHTRLVVKCIDLRRKQKFQQWAPCYEFNRIIDQCKTLRFTSCFK